MALKQMKVGPLPPDIEEIRNASTRLESLHLTQRTERELRNSGFVTAGQVASRSAEELKAFCYVTTTMVAEIEEALGRSGLRCGWGSFVESSWNCPSLFQSLLSCVMPCSQEMERDVRRIPHNPTVVTGRSWRYVEEHSSPECVDAAVLHRSRSTT